MNINKYRVFVFTITPILLCACAGISSSPAVPATPATYAAKVTMKSDPFTKSERFFGPQRLLAARFIATENLVALSDPEERSIHIFIETDRSPEKGWAFWSDAHDVNGKQLKLTVFKTNVDSQAYVEENVSIDVTKAYLESVPEQGIQIRMDGQNDQLLFDISKAEAAGFLDALSKLDPAAKF